MGEARLDRSPRSARELLLAPALHPPLDRAAAPEVVRAQVAATARRLAARLGRPATKASCLDRWRTLAALGRSDLVVARLVEGHLDALAILDEAGRAAQSDLLYGVWASASGGTGPRLTTAGDALALDGTMRFCSGADTVDRVLVTAKDDDEPVRLIDVAVDPVRMAPDRTSWPALGMDASDSFDVTVESLPVLASDLVGPAGFYVNRRGLPLGGIGVAAVWLGGAQGVLDAALQLLRRFGADEHQLAHIGAVTAAVESAAATLVTVASLLDAESSSRTGGDGRDADVDGLHRVANTCRSVVEAAVGVALQRLPRVAGPVALSRDADFAHRLADLEVYVRQHHAERDLARLGAAELAEPWSSACPSPAHDASHADA